MADKLSIINQALLLVGSAQLASPTDGTVTETTANAFYDDTIQSTLQHYTWSFATKRATLAQEVATPEFEYTYQYTLPSDAISVGFMYEADAEALSREKWRVENGKLLTNETSVKIRYTSRDVNEGEFSPVFVDAVVYLLASKLALSLKRDKQMQGQLLTIYEQKIAMARSVDAANGMVEEIRSSAFIDVRL